MVCALQISEINFVGICNLSHIYGSPTYVTFVNTRNAYTKKNMVKQISPL